MSIKNEKLEKLLSLLGIEDKEGSCSCKSEEFWKIGRCYFVRTVTMNTIGRLIGFSDNELIFEKAAWIADSGRWNNALVKGELSEVEPFPDKVCINRNSMIDATYWNHDLCREVK